MLSELTTVELDILTKLTKLFAVIVQVKRVEKWRGGRRRGGGEGREGEIKDKGG